MSDDDDDGGAAQLVDEEKEELFGSGARSNRDNEGGEDGLDEVIKLSKQRNMCLTDMNHSVQH